MRVEGSETDWAVADVERDGLGSGGCRATHPSRYVVSGSRG